MNFAYISLRLKNLFIPVRNKLHISVHLLFYKRYITGERKMALVRSRGSTLEHGATLERFYQRGNFRALLCISQRANRHSTIYKPDTLRGCSRKAAWYSTRLVRKLASRRITHGFWRDDECVHSFTLVTMRHCVYNF